jgi:predicted Zn-dependent protease
MRLAPACPCLLILTLALCAACATVPVTGRQQLMLVPQGQVNQMGDQAYEETLSKSKVVTGTPEANLVHDIGQRIAAVAPNTSEPWTFALIQDDTPNAFSLPGNHVVIQTGILKFAKTPAQLATVIAHEMGHDIANHGGERMSQQLLAQLGAAGLQAAVGSQSPAAMQALMTAYGAGAQVGFLLPFDRTQESEADRLGLTLMAKAGFDPQEAVQFWQSMMAAEGKQQQPPTFLSTHPADQQRIADLQKEMPQAMAAYKQATRQQVGQPSQQSAPGRSGFVFGPAN